MARPLLVLVSACACTIALAIPVLAAEPEAGEVSAATPTVKWSGEPVTEPTELLIAEGACDTPTPNPQCDTYTLTVKEPGTKLTVTIKGWEDDWPSVEIVPPEGDPVFVYESDTEATATIANPKPGEYTIHSMSASFRESPTGGYDATATLEVPKVEEEEKPPPPPPTIVTIDPTPTPAPAPPPAADPAPPAQAGPRTLALHADRRRLRRAVSKGFRVRMRCEGGCSTLQVRGYVSSLTASQLRLGNFRDEAEVAGARVLRDAEGRRVVMLRFKRSMRKRLARARRVPLAIELVATDPDGVVRTFVKRITLRR